MALDVAPPLDVTIPFRPPEHRTWLPGGVDHVPETLREEHDCKRCPLHRGVKTVCMDAAGSRALPLVVMGTPTARDDAAGQVAHGGATALVLDELKKHGGARMTFALRCAAGRGAEDTDVEACRPYLAGDVDAAPRVVALGPLAALALLGHEINAQRCRRARAFVRGKPVFVVADPVPASRNRFWKAHFREDLAWAMTAPIAPQPDGAVRVFLNPDEAVEWLEGRASDAPRAGRPLVVDTEHWPKGVWGPGEFRLLCVGLCTDVRSPRVIPEGLLALPSVLAALKRVMEDQSIPKVNQAIKHDRHVLWRSLGIDVLGVEHDTLLYAKLLDSENPASLGALSWKTGFGGVKKLGQIGADDEEDE